MRELLFHDYVRQRVARKQSTMEPRNNGHLSIHDSTLHIWEEGVDENSMHRDVLLPLVRKMRRMGWTVRLDPRINEHFKMLNKTHRRGRHGDLEVKIGLCGRHIEIEFFQNVANVENRSGGEYDFDKLDRMPYLLRLQTVMTISKLAEFLHAKHGYELKIKKPYKITTCLGRTGMTSREWIQAHYENSWHYNKELGRPNGDDRSYNNKSADKDIVKHGATVWIKDYKKRYWLRGTAYYNINNMWWVITGPYSMRNVASFKIHVNQPDNLRKQEDQGHRRKTLEDLMLKAIKSMDLDRAAFLRKKLFGERPLYRIWNKEKALWYRTCSQGYCDDIVSAGLYTQQEAERRASGISELEIRPA